MPACSEMVGYHNLITNYTICIISEHVSDNIIITSDSGDAAVKGCNGWYKDFSLGLSALIEEKG